MSRRVSVAAPGPDLATNSHDAGATAATSARPDLFPTEQAARDTIFARRQREELAQARRKHPDPVLSLHEGYAILAEEVDELWDLVRQRAKHRSRAAVLEELVQVAAMAQRIAEDLMFVQVLPTPPTLYQLAEADFSMARERAERQIEEQRGQITQLTADLRHAQARAKIAEGKAAARASSARRKAVRR